MFKSFFLAIALFFSLMTASFAQTTPNFDNVAASTFNVWIKVNDDIKAVCTGEFISPTYLLTAGHCVVFDDKDMKGAISYLILLPDKVHELVPINVSRTKDIALFKLVDGNSDSWVDISPVNVSRGASLYVYCYNGGAPKATLSTGNFLTEITTQLGDEPVANHLALFTLSDGKVVQGCSGGGVYVNRSNRLYLVGTISGISEAADKDNPIAITTLDAVRNILD